MRRDVIRRGASAHSSEAAADAAYLTPAAAARYTGFTARALETLRHRGQGPRFFKVGRQERYRVADLRAWIEGEDPS